MKTEKLNRELKQEELEPFSQQYPETKRWLRKIESPLSRYRYTRSLIHYCETTEKTPSELIDLKKNSKEHEAEDLLDEFVEEAQKANHPNSMIWDIAISVKSFYKWNYQDLSRGAGKITLVRLKPYRTPDKETLQKFLEGAHLRDKALISVVACTGISKGSLPLLKWSHIWNDLIEKNLDIPHIGLTSSEIKGRGKGKYEGVQQVTFLTPYARKTLLAYREWRERKECSPLTPESYMFVSITRPFKKLTIGNVTRIFKQRSKDTGITFSPHDLRRFVQTGLERARLQPNWIKKILRHKVAGEENPYSQPKIEELREAYRSALPYLDLSEKPTLTKEDIRKEVASTIPDAVLDPIARNMGITLEQLRINMASGTEEKETETENDKESLEPIKREDCELLISEDELEDRLKHGFHFVATLPSGKIVVSNDP